MGHQHFYLFATSLFHSLLIFRYPLLNLLRGLILRKQKATSFYTDGPRFICTDKIKLSNSSKIKIYYKVFQTSLHFRDLRVGVLTTTQTIPAIQTLVASTASYCYVSAHIAGRCIALHIFCSSIGGTHTHSRRLGSISSFVWFYFWF